MSRSLLPNTTQIPDVILDEWMALLEGAELKVVLYVARRTYGFGKPADRISIGQMVNGIKRGDGEVLDRGTGLSERAVQTACDYLVACGVLLRQRHVPEKHEVQLPAYFKINLAWEGELLDRKKWRAGVSEAAEVPVKKPVAPPQSLHPCNDCTPAMSSVAPPQSLHPQETVRQETEKTPKPPRGASRCVSYPKDFEVFWQAYPKHVDKEMAYAAWQALAPDSATVEVMLAVIARSRLSEQWIEGKILDPARWLKRRRWESDPPPLPKGAEDPAAPVTTAPARAPKIYRLEDDADWQAQQAAAASVKSPLAPKGRPA